MELTWQMLLTFKMELFDRSLHIRFASGRVERCVSEKGYLGGK